MKPRILLVDDSPSILNIEKEFLKGLNLEILTASTGTEALRKITTEKPVLVFLDLMLPELNGDILCKYIKGKEELKDIAVIIVTAKDDPKQIQRCYQAGCDAYVVKPIKEQDIVEKTKIILSEKGISI